MNAMHTESLAGRFAGPAAVAVAIHAVFLLGFPDSVRPLVAPVEPPATLLRAADVLELFRPPEAPVEPADSIAPVQALSGGPARPETADRSVNRLSDFVAPTSVRVPVLAPTGPAIAVPREWGDGSPGDGRPRVGEWRPLRVADLDRTPRAKVRVAPDYPLALRQTGVEGSALIEFDVDATGRVVAARVLRGSEREFGEAAVRAVLRWRFEPGRRDGRAVPFRMAVPVEFSLAGD